MSIELAERSVQKPIADDLSYLEHQFAPDNLYAEQASGIYVPIPKNLNIITACSDDRSPTPESAKDLNNSFTNILHVNEGYARIWGGKYGVALGIMATGSIVHGEGFVQKAGGYKGIVGAIERATSNRAISHSAEGNEKSPATFCAHGNAGLGCLACVAMGAAVSALLADEHILNTAHADQKAVFGTDNNFHRALLGFDTVAQEFARISPNGHIAGFNVSRQDFIEDINRGNKIMILKGDHALARDTQVVLNLEPRSVSNPTEANRIGHPLYSVDVATVGEEVGTLMQEYDLNWKDYHSVIAGITTVVRGALVAHDKDEATSSHGMKPEHLRMTVRGDANESIKYLERKFGN